MKLRYVLDASVMAAVINMDDPEHQNCIAKAENIPLVTHDRDFDPYEGTIKIISAAGSMSEQPNNRFEFALPRPTRKVRCTSLAAYARR